MQQPQWNGAFPQKWSGGRKHLHPQNQLGPGLKLNPVFHQTGLKTFEFNPTPQILSKPSLKIFSEKYNSEQRQIDLRGKKSIELPDQIQRKRPQLKHIKGGQQTYKQFQLKGIKNYSQANKSKETEYTLQNKLQRKARILGLQSSRNEIEVHSLGDKSYKYPEYAPDFYKSGGLIPGSTNKYYSKRNQFTISQNQLKSVFTKPHWHIKQKLDQIQQDQKYLNKIDQWQQTILKQNNPKWNDPDTFFQRMEANQGTGKDLKKAAKK